MAQNISDIGLTLSGYDVPSLPVLQFRAQMSYDDSKGSFEIVLSLINGTQFYFINYFVLVVTAEGAPFLQVV